MKRAMSSFGSTKPSVGGGNKAPNIQEQVDLLEYPKSGGSVQVRYIGPIAPRGLHKIKVIKKDGTETQITKACLAFNPEIDDRDSKLSCPYCDMDKDITTFTKIYFSNAIDRRLEEDKPAKIKVSSKEKETGIKNMESSSWTPVRVSRIPSTLALRLKKLGERNIVKSKTGEKKTFPVNHKKYGFDVDVSFDKNLPAASMYSADRNLDERYTPLTEEEEAYLIYDLEVLYTPEDEETAEKEANSLADRWSNGGKASDPKKSIKKRKPKDEDEDDDDDIIEDEDDEDGDKPSKKSSKKSSKKPTSKRGKKDEDEDLLEDEDDDDLLEDDEDEEEEEEEKPKKKAKPTKHHKAEDEEDEEEDEEDEEDEDLEEDEEEDQEEEKPKKSSKGKTSSKKRPTKDEEEEDDLDDGLEDDEDEEEEEEKPRKKSSKTKPTPTSKNRKSKDEDDDGDIPF
jgi:hypothetical protein